MKFMISYDYFSIVVRQFYNIFCNYENLVKLYKDSRQTMDDLAYNVFFEHFGQVDFLQ